jgi:hypothetical protein
MDSGLAASRRPGMTADMIRISEAMYEIVDCGLVAQVKAPKPAEAVG